MYKNMIITWGKSKEINFDGPYPISRWDPPFRAAIYAIMIKPEPINKPNIYTIIYFGESGNLSERGFYKSHHAYNCWIREAGNESNLFIGIHTIPNSTEEERLKIEQQLISEYNPTCNK